MDLSMSFPDNGVEMRPENDASRYACLGEQVFLWVHWLHHLDLCNSEKEIIPSQRF